MKDFIEETIEKIKDVESQGYNYLDKWCLEKFKEFGYEKESVNLEDIEIFLENTGVKLERYVYSEINLTSYIITNGKKIYVLHAWNEIDLENNTVVFKMKEEEI